MFRTSVYKPIFAEFRVARRFDFDPLNALLMLIATIAVIVLLQLLKVRNAADVICS